jgi:hypothetical protein
MLSLVLFMGNPPETAEKYQIWFRPFYIIHVKNIIFIAKPYFYAKMETLPRIRLQNWRI